MARRIAIGGLGVASVLLLYLLLFAGAGGVWLLEVLIALFPFGLILLAVPAGRGTRRSRYLGWALLSLAVLVLGSSLLMQAASARPRAWSMAGLPVSTWSLILGIAVIPLLVFGVTYALSFGGGGEGHQDDLHDEPPTGGSAS